MSPARKTARIPNNAKTSGSGNHRSLQSASAKPKRTRAPSLFDPADSAGISESPLLKWASSALVATCREALCYTTITGDRPVRQNVLSKCSCQSQNVRQNESKGLVSLESLRAEHLGERHCVSSHGRYDGEPREFASQLLSAGAGRETVGGAGGTHPGEGKQASVEGPSTLRCRLLASSGPQRQTVNGKRSTVLGSALFQVALPTVTIGHHHAAAHEPGGWNQQQEHGLVDSPLPCFRAGGNVARAHGAALAQRRRSDTQPAKEKEHSQKCAANFHLTSMPHQLALFTLRLFREGSKPSSTNHESLSGRSLHAQRNDPVCIGKEKDSHQDQASYHGAHGDPLHARNFIPQMHEEPDNQRRLDQRQSHQNRQHLYRLHVLIGQIHLNPSDNQ